MSGSKRVKPTIELAKSFAAKRNGKCLSQKCSSAKDKLRWSCENDIHQWFASYDSVKRGSWCPGCSKNVRLTLKDAKKTAQDKDGFCLSTTYVNSRTPLKWKCKNGHAWLQSYEVIRAGSWCGKCFAPGFKQTIEDMQDLARSRGGECLSEKYVSARSKLIWQCELKHKHWKATPDTVKRGRWCPECQSGIGERICRRYLEVIFKSDFKKERPGFLLNTKTGYNLELDGFNSQLKIAFEHHGRQHFKINSYFSQNKETLHLRKELDQFKRLKCKELGIRLIEFPSIPDMLSFSKLEEFLKSEFVRLGLDVSLIIPLSEVDFSKVFSPDMSHLINEMHEIAKLKNGKCLSSIYLGFHGKLKWQCGKNHPAWEASPAKIKSGRWCPTCGGRQKKTLSDVLELAKSLSFRLLSKEYKNGKLKLKWQCSHLHTWQASYDSVARGSRCPHCHNLWKKSGYKLKK